MDQTRTRYGGSEALRHLPSQVDPRSVVAQSKLEDDPRLITMWAGYAFSTDFREERGHAYMLDDQRYTRRVTEFKQPGTCLNCHASTYVTMKKLGGGDIFKGFEQINHMPYLEATKLVKHPVACIDCHDPQTMALRVTGPAFIEGIRRVQGIAGRAELRSEQGCQARRRCGRTFAASAMWSITSKVTRSGSRSRGQRGCEWTTRSPTTTRSGSRTGSTRRPGANALKAQHPEFEMYNQGVHARSGVACADCHMPYKREGGMKISDHHVRSPMLNINRACQGCHHFDEEELKNRVEAIQARFANQRDTRDGRAGGTDQRYQRRTGQGCQKPI